MNTLKTKSVSWYNIYRPANTDIQWLRANFKFHDLVYQELMRPTPRPKVHRFDHYLYLVLHFPIFDDKVRKTYAREIDFILTKKEIITVSYEPIPPLEEFFRKCAVDKSCEELYASRMPIHLFYNLVKELYGYSLRELDHIQQNITDIEEGVFSGKEREVVEEISFVGRDIIDFRRSLRPQEITLQSLAVEGTLLFGKEALPFLEGLAGEHQKLWSLLENNKETLDALYETNTTLLNIKQSDTMRTLTIIATTTFPLTLAATLLAINTSSNPFIGWPGDFWVIAGLLLLGVFVILVIFKRKKWL